MGLGVHGINFLLYAQKKGVSFAETAMIGRQSMRITPELLENCFRGFGVNLDGSEAKDLLSNGFAEPLLKRLGAQNVSSFDASDYENPTFVHDFNQPIPEKFKNKYSVVMEGGTLEHVFNFPIAIKNCMEMIREGGHFLSLSPANNYMGHGFYQFSPELFYRVLNEKNGFQIEKIFIYEESTQSAWFEVSDPDAIKERVTLINDHPSLMLIIAKKIKTVEIFKEFPQQSDYVARWQKGDGDNYQKLNGNGGGQNLTLDKIFRIPLSVLRRTQTKLNHRFGMLNRRPKHFKKINPN